MVRLGGLDPVPWQLDNGEVCLTFLPDLGGRLLSLACHGVELLWQNPSFVDRKSLHMIRPRAEWPPLDGGMGSWANVGGSKTWPAPQGWDGPGQWSGPPDPVLDSGRWSFDHGLSADGSSWVRMISPDDPRTGLRLTREFRVPPGREFTQRSTFTNVSDHPVTWSVWEIAQVDTASGVGRPQASIEISVLDDDEPFSMIEAVDRIQVGPRNAEGYRHIPIRDAVGKVGFANAGGQITYRRPDGASIEMAFTPMARMPYPDGGAQVEVWMQCPLDEPLSAWGGLHPEAYLAELEVLGPTTTLAPGQETFLDLTWRIGPPAASA